MQWHEFSAQWSELTHQNCPSHPVHSNSSPSTCQDIMSAEKENINSQKEFEFTDPSSSTGFGFLYKRTVVGMKTILHIPSIRLLVANLQKVINASISDARDNSARLGNRNLNNIIVQHDLQEKIQAEHPFGRYPSPWLWRSTKRYTQFISHFIALLLTIWSSIKLISGNHVSARSYPGHTLSNRQK